MQYNVPTTITNSTCTARSSSKNLHPKTSNRMSMPTPEIWRLSKLVSFRKKENRKTQNSVQLVCITTLSEALYRVRAANKAIP